MISSALHDGREPVRDHERGAALRHPVERVLDFLLGVAVERGGRLVEQQDRRAFQDGARDGDALLLAAGQFQAALADFGLVALGAELDEIVDLREPRGLLDLGIARIPAAVADIVADRVVEQHGVLRDHADGRAQRYLRHVADILTVDQDAAAGDVVEAEQQPRDRRLAGAGRPDDRDRVPGRHLEADALQDRTRRLIGEADIVEADRALRHLQSRRARLVLDLRIARQHAEHDLDIGHRLLDLAIDHAHEIQRLIELDHHGVDHDEIADRIGAVLDAVARTSPSRRRGPTVKIAACPALSTASEV